MKMKWAAATIIILSFLLGFEQGWDDPTRDVIFYPAFGFIFGLIIFWLLRAALSHFHQHYDDREIGLTIFGISSTVALYYAILAGTGIYLRYTGGLICWLIASALFCWAIGWAVRRNFSGKISNLDAAE
jgi:hypothetical protein